MKKYWLVFVVSLFFPFSAAIAFNSNVALNDALSRLPSSAERIKTDLKVVMIVPFEYGKDVDQKNVEDKVAWALAKTGKFKVMDKASLKEVFEQQKLSLTGFTEETEARKVGKLLNADAILIGKVNMSSDNIIVNLTLKDVATGALIWADEFIGEDLTRIYFGPGIRSGFFNASLPITITFPVTYNQVIVQPPDINNGFFFAFSFSYVQRMQDLKAISFGLDGVFYRGFAQFDDINKSLTDGTSTYDFTATGSYTDLKLNLCTLLRVHLSYILGLGSDFLVLYTGPGLDGNYILASTKYKLKQTAGGTFDTGEINYEKQFGQALAFGGVTFRIGLEMKFTSAFSAFVEAYYIPSFTYTFNDIESGATQHIVPKWTVGPGNNFYGMGMRYLVF